jgi:hypothetical protein
MSSPTASCSFLSVEDALIGLCPEVVDRLDLLTPIERESWLPDQIEVVNRVLDRHLRGEDLRVAARHL